MSKKVFTDVVLYLAVFVAIQFAVNAIAAFVCQTHSFTPMTGIVCNIISNALTIALFVWRRWTPVGSGYINQRPWFALFWVVCLAVGSCTPLSFAIEQAGITLPDSDVQLFKGIMQHDLGYLAVGVLAPVAEEMIFRGAILRRLLDTMGKRREWAAITATALLFAVVHGNMAQGINAFVLGLLLGWMYARTRSLVPGVAMHLTNNTISFISFRLFPDSADKTIVELYGGNMTHVWLAVGYSLLIFLTALYQLNKRLRPCPTAPQKTNKK